MVHPDYVFDLYFGAVVSMQFHPGAGTKEHRRLSLDECAEIALDMLRIREEKLKCLAQS